MLFPDNIKETIEIYVASFSVSLSMPLYKMGRLIIQLFSLLCLITSLAAEPICKNVVTEKINLCRSLVRQWFTLLDENYVKTCPSLRSGTDGYKICMETVKDRTMKQILSEWKNELKDGHPSFLFRGGLRIDPIRDSEGHPVIRTHKDEKKPWYSFIFG